MRAYSTIIALLLGLFHVLSISSYADPQHFVRGRVILDSSSQSNESFSDLFAFGGKKFQSLSGKNLSPRTVTLFVQRKKLQERKDDFIPYSNARNPCNLPVIKRFLRIHREYSCEPDWKVQLTATPNDTLLSSVYSASTSAAGRIHSREAWDITTGSGNTVVGIIDTGIDYNHLDLSTNVWTNAAEIPGNSSDDDGNGYIDDVHGYDFYNNDSNPMDDHGHGTAVSGTIGAIGNNALGVVGINWNVKMIACKAFNASGSGTLSAIINCLNYMVVLKRNFGVNIAVTNNSYGGFPNSTSFSNAIAATRDQGIVYSAGAGNNTSNNDTTPFYPASFDLDNIIVVAATDSNAAMTSFSNFGASSVDIAAPGIGVYTTGPNNAYGTYQGTSIATPHVTGAIALIRDYHPSFTYLQAIDAVLSTGTSVSALADKCTSGSILNVGQALQYSLPEPTPTPSVSPTEVPITTPSPNLSTARLVLSVSHSSSKTIARCRLSAQKGTSYVGLPGYQVKLTSKSFSTKRGITNSKGQASFSFRPSQDRSRFAQCVAKVTDDSNQPRTIRSKKVGLFR